jgi:hypothetical protein
MANPMMEGFLEFLHQREPAAGRAAEQFLRGDMDLPGASTETSGGQAGERGVQEGDVVVALVGGFFPYVLHPVEQDDTGSATNTFRFVGDCYLHGMMHGEEFKMKGVDGRERWVTNLSKLRNISIV